jgi:hypothetical protein
MIRRWFLERLEKHFKEQQEELQKAKRKSR